MGRDCVVELVENGVFQNKKIEGQIKGTTVPQEITRGLYYSLPMETKTLNYGLHASNAFVLFLVILKGGKGKERVYICLFKNILSSILSSMKSLKVVRRS